MIEDILKKPMYLNDQETDIDFINNKSIADIALKLINNEKQPMTIGIHGDWGSGKSSILKMIESEIKKNGDILCINFNGWQFQGFQDAKIAIIEDIVTKIINSKKLWNEASDLVKDIVHSINWMKAGKIAIDFISLTQTGLPLSQCFNIPESSDAEKKDLKQTIGTEFLKFQKSFEDLINKTNYKRLVIIIDDLDRCLPKTVIDTLEAIKLFLFLPKTTFIIAADEKMIEYSVQKHFPDIEKNKEFENYSRHYLEKLIQVPIRITSLGEIESHIYISLLLLDTIEKSSNDFNTIKSYALNIMKKPWEPKTISIEELKDIPEYKKETIKSVIKMVDYINPTLSAITKGNPRQIKRFLNTMNMRLQVADAKGFGDNLNVFILAKLMLLELSLPDVFDQVVESASQNDKGICSEILSFTNKTHFKKLNIPVKESIIEDWAKNDKMMKWIHSEPTIDLINLKPYLFVMKDKLRLFMSKSSLSTELENIATKLLNGKMAAATCSNDLKNLSKEDTEILFDTIRKHFELEEKLDSLPQSIIALRKIIQYHPEFEVKYIEILESIPIKKVNIWIASGNNLKTKVAIEKFKKHCDTLLADSSTNPAVKKALQLIE